MKRRLALQRVALLVGGAISAPSLAAVLNSCKSPGDSAASGFKLASDQQSLLAEIAEVIIPKTDTPGAKETGTPEIIEVLLRDCYSEKQQKHFTEGLKSVEDESKKIGNNFTSLGDDDKMKVLEIMRTKAKEGREKAKEKQGEEIDSESGSKKENLSEEEPLIPFFNIMKDLTVFGYYSSEFGVTKAFNYTPVPGRWDACIKVDPSTLAYS